MHRIIFNRIKIDVWMSDGMILSIQIFLFLYSHTHTHAHTHTLSLSFSKESL